MTPKNTSAGTITPAAQSQAMLEVSGLNGWYGESHVLYDVNLRVNAGEVVTLLGRNGAGKTTTLKAIMGLLKARSGSIRFQGNEIIDTPARSVAKMGVGYVPDDRGIFGSLATSSFITRPSRPVPVT